MMETVLSRCAKLTSSFILHDLPPGFPQDSCSSFRVIGSELSLTLGIQIAQCRYVGNICILGALKALIIPVIPSITLVSISFSFSMFFSS